MAESSHDIKNVAIAMSDRDLEWQIKNAKKLGIPGRVNQAFKDELNSRRKASRSEVMTAVLGGFKFNE